MLPQFSMCRLDAPAPSPCAPRAAANANAICYLIALDVIRMNSRNQSVDRNYKIVAMYVICMWHDACMTHFVCGIACHWASCHTVVWWSGMRTIHISGVVVRANALHTPFCFTSINCSWSYASFRLPRHSKCTDRYDGPRTRSSALNNKFIRANLLEMGVWITSKVVECNRY